MIDKPASIKILSVKGNYVNFIYRTSNGRLRMEKTDSEKSIEPQTPY